MTPYEGACQAYLAAGWTGVLPLPYGLKAKVPVGFSGGIDKPDPSGADYYEWLHGAPINWYEPSILPGNVCLRMPDDGTTAVIGIDVDHYADKTGGTTLAGWVAQWGPLPDTICSSARDDGVSGIRFYTVPAGLAWHGGDSIEVIHRGHRYAVAWPSLHPSGAQYTWRVGSVVGPPLAPGTVPLRSDPAPLPPAWVEGLTHGGELASAHPRAGTAAGRAWLATLRPGEQVCPAVAAAVQRGCETLRTRGAKARHDVAMGATWELAKLHHEGHQGADSGLRAVELAFTRATDDPARTDDPGEFGRMVDGAARKVAALPGVDFGPCYTDAMRCAVPPPDFVGGPAADAGWRAGAYNLPADFWAKRVALSKIQQAAHARLLSPDAVLHAVLARLSSMIAPSVRVDTGLGRASLNVYTLLIGDSGTGKSQANRCARDLMPAPALPNGYLDSLPVGSGEGLAEAFYGVKEVDNGNGGTKKVRAKVRDNASFFADEGEALTKQMERAGTTIGQVLRTAWMGDTLGQVNATDQTKRIVDADTYSLGLIIGYQVATVGPMLTDGGGGTPQRFLFALSTSPDIPCERTPWPGMFQNVEHMLPHGEDFRLPETAREEVWRARHAANSGASAPEHQGLSVHWPLHMTKLAGLLAVLDYRDKITEEDWEMARLVWRTSCAVRDWLVGHYARMAMDEAQQRENVKVRTAVRSTVEADAAKEAVTEQKVARLAMRLASLVNDRGIRSVDGRGGLRAATASRDRVLLDDAVDVAVASGWLTIGNNDQLLPGPTPVSNVGQYQVSNG